MYKIIKNPTEELDKNLNLILDFLKNNSNRTSSRYEVVTNLGLNFVDSTFNLEVTLKEITENFELDLVKFDFPILYSEEFSVESAQVAYRLLKQYYAESEDIILDRQRQSFKELNSKLIITNNLSDDFNKYFSDEEIQKIIAA